MKNLFIRSLSGLIYISIIIIAIYFGVNTIAILASLFGVLATIELATIDHEISKTNLPLIILDCVGCVCLSMAYMLFPLLLWCIVILLRFILQLYTSSKRPLRDLAFSALSQVYIGMPMACMALIAEFYNPWMVLAIFLLIWLNDTGAYVVGSLLGRHRLFERVSPKKSWEGFLGALLICSLSSYFFSTYFAEFFGFHDTVKWIALGVLVVIFSTWGDLVESLIKRSLSIKDSGNLIPGHGGILDRIDSMLFVFPASLVYLASMYFI